MGFFKTKEEKAIIAQMERDEQLQVFNDQIKELKVKREEYAAVAAEAEVNGDEGTYEVAVGALIELNDVISGLMQTKANFDIINISNSITSTMTTAMNALEVMAGSQTNLPNIRKIQRAQAKITQHMRDIRISNRAMAGAMRSASPASKARSAAEIASVRPMIDAARAKLTSKSMPSPVSSDLDISAEIEAEKNRLI